MSVRTDLSRVDLRAAKLCMELDCNTIFDGAGFRHCPSCGSYESYPLESWLNRERLPETSPEALLEGLGKDSVSLEQRARWLMRLREKRGESAASPGGGPLTLRPRNPRRRLG